MCRGTVCDNSLYSTQGPHTVGTILCRMVRPSRNRCSCCEICLIALLLFVLLSDPHPLRSHSPASVRSSQLDQGALQAIIPAEFTPFGTARFVFVLRSLWLPTNSVFLTFDLFIDCMDCRHCTGAGPIWVGQKFANEPICISDYQASIFDCLFMSTNNNKTCTHNRVRTCVAVRFWC